MPEPVAFPIPVRGALDTKDPESALPTGTLIDATDLAHRHIGPRPGRSVAGTVNGLSQPARTMLTFGGVDTYILYPYLAEQHVMGLGWSIDLVFEFTGLSSSPMAIYCHGSTANNDILITLLGSGSAAGDQRKVRAIVSASTASAISTTTTLTGTTQLTQSGGASPAVTPTVIHHVRLVRNAGSLYLYVNGALEASDTSTISSTVGNAGPGSDAGTALGRNSASAANTYFTGWIYKALVRNGIHQDLSDGFLDTCHASDPVVLLYANGGINLFFMTTEAINAGQEMSRFRNYGTVNGTEAYDSAANGFPSRPIQSIMHYTDRYGRLINLVECNGRIFYDRAT